MNRKLSMPLALTAVIASGCALDTTQDFGLDSGDLTAMQAGIWIDPNGCDHWIIDDGVEGYLTPRLMPDGTPVCRDPSQITGETENFVRRAADSKDRDGDGVADTDEDS